MKDMRKITVVVDESDLAAAQAFTGEGVTATVRAGLKRLASAEAQRQLLELRGKVRFAMTLEDLRFDRE